MLPGEAPPGRGAPGRAAPGRGACGRGMGRSTGCADENGLLPTRGGRIPGLGIGSLAARDAGRESHREGRPAEPPERAAVPGWARGRAAPAVRATAPWAPGGSRGGGAPEEVATAPLSVFACAPVASPLPEALGIALSRALSSDFSTPWLAGLAAALAGP